jgi:23S rRNA pseudouridine2605 synthase
MKNGKQHGCDTVYRKDGSVLIGMYENGKLHETVAEYDGTPAELRKVKPIFPDIRLTQEQKDAYAAVRSHYKEMREKKRSEKAGNPDQVKPRFMGMEARYFSTWVNGQLKYPREAKKVKAEGCTVLQFEVTVNGEVTLNPAHRVSPDEVVTLDGNTITPAEKKWYILLHKPRGYVCSNADSHAEKLAVDLLKEIPARLVSAGRLDKESEGAIIFSDDGDFINRLAHPRYGVLKRYIVETARPLPPHAMTEMIAGISDGGEMLRVIAVKPLAARRYEVTLNEGKKREIRRLTAFFGCITTRLRRISIGSVELGELPAGAFRELTTGEITALLTPTAHDGQ